MNCLVRVLWRGVKTCYEAISAVLTAVLTARPHPRDQGLQEEEEVCSNRWICGLEEYWSHEEKGDNQNLGDLSRGICEDTMYTVHYGLAPWARRLAPSWPGTQLSSRMEKLVDSEPRDLSLNPALLYSIMCLGAEHILCQTINFNKLGNEC